MTTIERLKERLTSPHSTSRMFSDVRANQLAIMEALVDLLEKKSPVAPVPTKPTLGPPVTYTKGHDPDQCPAT